MDEQPLSLPSAEPAPEPPAGPNEKPPLQEHLFRYTSADVAGLLAITLTVVSLVACIPGLNYALYLLPIAALVLGIIAIVQWRRAVDPERTKVTGWISVVVMALLILLIVVCCCACAAFYSVAIIGSGGSYSSYN